MFGRSSSATNRRLGRGRDGLLHQKRLGPRSPNLPLTPLREVGQGQAVGVQPRPLAPGRGPHLQAQATPVVPGAQMKHGLRPIGNWPTTQQMLLLPGSPTATATPMVAAAAVVRGIVRVHKMRQTSSAALTNLVGTAAMPTTGQPTSGRLPATDGPQTTPEGTSVAAGTDATRV